MSGPQKIPVEILPSDRAHNATGEGYLAQAHEHHTAAIEAGGHMVCHVIFAGHALNQAQTALGYRQGRPGANAPAKAFATWEDYLEANGQIAYRTAARYMQLAAEAKKRIPALAAAFAKNDGDAVFALLAEAVKPGTTLTDIMAEWGMSKTKALTTGEESPPDPDPPKKPSRKEQARLLLLTPLQKLTQSMANPDLFAKSWHHLDTPELEAAIDTLTQALEAAKLAKKSKTK